MSFPDDVNARKAADGRGSRACQAHGHGIGASANERPPVHRDVADGLNLKMEHRVVWRALVPVLALSGAMLTSAAGAETITDPQQIVAKMRFWADGPAEPVYYGEVRSVDKRTKRILGHYQCLALAFIKVDNGVIHYAHKMWSKSRDGSCHYEDVKSVKVGNHGACVKDTDAGFGLAAGTARMTKANIDPARSIFRTVNMATRRVGETAACIPPRGQTAGLYSMKIEDGRIKLITTRPLDYEVSVDAQDPRNPPTKPVF